MATLTIVSWNVNGIRAAVKKGLGDFLKERRPDILGLQEVKITDAAREKEEFDFADYAEYWNPAERPGYSGTATLTKPLPLQVTTGIGDPAFDLEGRVQTLEFNDFYFVNAYFPNTQHGLTRLQYKCDFNDAFLHHVRQLERQKPLIIVGDFNVAREEIDLARPKDNVGNPGFTDEERAWARTFLKAGFLDTFREIRGDEVRYSWWSYKFFARDRNIGWRIDYVFLSPALRSRLVDAFIWDDVYGSDHAPVGITLTC